ncbi:MAG: ATP-binding protein, partial [bacterium]
LDPRWGRVDQLLSFLPPESRSVRSRPQYMNALRWICGVLSRIRHFMEERNNRDVYEDFDISEDLQDFVRNVIYGYVTMNTSARVEIQIDRMDSAVVGGNRYRFRRMFFNLVMNAVDAMRDKRFGILNISNVVDGERSDLRVRDNGSGMPAEKIERLLEDKTNLDGEVHSLGFVFVRRTIADFGGKVAIDSKIGKGTTVTVSFPIKTGVEPVPVEASECEELGLDREIGEIRLQGRAAYAKKATAPGDDTLEACGEIIFADYKISDAQFPGSIFAIGVTGDNKIDFFTHRPYERYWNITHEDLSPMFFEATVRGRVEEDEDQTPTLILKAPQNAREYFEFREVPEVERSQDRYIHMVHDEYIRIARKLIDTGMSPQIEVRVTDVGKLFPQNEELLRTEVFSLDTLARQTLNSETPT